MASLLSLSKYIVKGTKAKEVNKLLREEIVSRGITTKPFQVRNGIAVLDNGTEHYGTTKLRDFVGLNESGDLVTLKSKSTYHRKPYADDPRRLSSATSAYPAEGITRHRAAENVNGRIPYNRNWVANDGGGSADTFYRMGFGDTGAIINRGSNVRYIADPLGKRGAAFNATVNGQPVKGYYNPNLGSGYVSGLSGETKGKIVSKEQYDSILGNIQDVVHGFAVRLKSL